MSKVAISSSTLKILVNRDSAGISSLANLCCLGLFECGECCPGFGEDSTPSQYTVIISDIEDCPGFPSDATSVNGTWTLDLVECEPLPWPEEPGCTWEYKEAESNNNVWIVLVRNHTIGCATITVSAFVYYDGNWRGVYQKIGSYIHASGWCGTIAQTGTCASFRQGINGTASFEPANMPAWVIGKNYIIITSKTTNGGNLYVCILSHTSEASNEPGIGGSWETYWSLCEDMNVSCP